MTAVEIDSHVPQIRPHNRRRGLQIYFLISRRPLLTLDPEDISLYESIDGHATVADLERKYPAARDRLVRWREAEIIELIPPNAPPTGPHLVVIEPHMDDAALSVGGRLLKRRGQGRITILSVIRRSNFTSYLKLKRDFIDVEEVTKLRQQESALAARLLGADHHGLDWTDGPLRFWPAERWCSETIETFDAEPRTFAYLFPDRSEVSRLARDLTKALNLLAPDELWIPMGLGDHVDHRTTRSACLKMLCDASSRFAGMPVSMYEDLPYAAAEGHAAQISKAFAASGTRLVRGSEDVTDVFEEKLRAVSAFASQFKRSYIEPELHGLASRAGGAGRLAEVLHRIQGAPSLPPESLLSRNAPGLALLKSATRRVSAQGTDCRRLTVMALPSGHLGRWESDSEILAGMFPRAHLRIFAAERIRWQAEAGGASGLKLEIVRGGWKGWAGAIAREAFHFRTPTVVLWWGAYHSRFRRAAIRCLLPFRRVMFAASLRDFCGVLTECAGEMPSETEAHDRPTVSISPLT
jgi:LmbE family N-acetylglucosaminyl deacetylase